MSKERRGRRYQFLLTVANPIGGGGVGDVKFHIINAQAPFQVPLLGGGSVDVIPLPVHHGTVHGRPFECLGFRIDTLSYVSDCHHIPASTTKLMAGSQVITMDSLNPYRHASHFSLSQALSFTLSMPDPAPRLALLTDVTHHLEHYQTERNIQSWRKEMQAIQIKQLQDKTSISIEKVGKGEAGGPRWWDGKWDEHRAERRMKGGLSHSLIGPSEISDSTSASLEGFLPEIHLAYDGMVVDFESNQ